MEDGAIEAPGQRFRQLGAPFDGETVVPERLVLGFELDPLGSVGGQAETACPSKGIARQLLERIGRCD